MIYVIMNRGSLEGHQKGYFETVPPCFYQEAIVDDTEQVRYIWTPVLGLASRFATERQAWDFAKAVWGLKHSFNTFFVISVHQEALNSSTNSRDLILERYSDG